MDWSGQGFIPEALLNRAPLEVGDFTGLREDALSNSHTLTHTHTHPGGGLGNTKSLGGGNWGVPLFVPLIASLSSSVPTSLSSLSEGGGVLVWRKVLSLSLHSCRNTMSCLRCETSSSSNSLCV